MDSNKEDILLLHNSPDKLIIRFQPLIEIIVSKHIHNGYCTFDQREDVIQHINEKLIAKSGTIKKQFNGTTLLRTYYSAIIRNLIMEFLRVEMKFKNESYKINNCDAVVQENNCISMALIDEFERFEVIIDMFGRQSKKLILCLKIFFRIPVSYNDFLKYCAKMTKRSFNAIFKALKPENQIEDKYIYDILTPVLNKCDNKNNSPDAIRKWFKHKKEEILRLMNGDPQRANYDDEVMQILTEKYFMDYKKDEE